MGEVDLEVCADVEDHIVNTKCQTVLELYRSVVTVLLNKKFHTQIPITNKKHSEILELEVITKDMNTEVGLLRILVMGATLIIHFRLDGGVLLSWSQDLSKCIRFDVPISYQSFKSPIPDFNDINSALVESSELQLRAREFDINLPLMDKLPTPVLHKIFSNLSGKDLKEVCFVSKRFLSVAYSDDLWKTICQSHSWYTRIRDPESLTGRWRKVYINYQVSRTKRRSQLMSRNPHIMIINRRRHRRGNNAQPEAAGAAPDDVRPIMVIDRRRGRRNNQVQVHIGGRAERQNAGRHLNRAAPQPGHRAAPQPGNRAAPQPGNRAAPQPGNRAAPQPGNRAAPQPGNRAAPQPGNLAAQPHRAAQRDNIREAPLPAPAPHARPADHMPRQPAGFSYEYRGRLGNPNINISIREVQHAANGENNIAVINNAANHPLNNNVVNNNPLNTNAGNIIVPNQNAANNPVNINDNVVDNVMNNNAANNPLNDDAANNNAANNAASIITANRNIIATIRNEANNPLNNNAVNNPMNNNSINNNPVHLPLVSSSSGAPNPPNDRQLYELLYTQVVEQLQLPTNRTSSNLTNFNSLSVLQRLLVTRIKNVLALVLGRSQIKPSQVTYVFPKYDSRNHRERHGVLDTDIRLLSFLDELRAMFQSKPLQVNLDMSDYEKCEAGESSLDLVEDSYSVIKITQMLIAALSYERCSPLLPEAIVMETASEQSKSSQQSDNTWLSGARYKLRVYADTDAQVIDIVRDNISYLDKATSNEASSFSSTSTSSANIGNIRVPQSTSTSYPDNTDDIPAISSTSSPSNNISNSASHQGKSGKRRVPTDNGIEIIDEKPGKLPKTELSS